MVVGSAMLVYGGLVDMKGSLQDFWSLDFGALKLQPHTLSHTTVSVVTARLCVTDSMSWSLLSDSQSGSLGPGCRHGHSAMAHQSCMYLFGGLKGLREQRDFWKWNSSSHTWTSLKTK